MSHPLVRFVVRRFGVSLRSAALSLALVLGLHQGALAADLPQPTGDVILTVSGAITNTNGDGVARFDREMLVALGEESFETTTIWTEGMQTFTGVPLEALLKAVGATGTQLEATALNDYTVSIPVSDAVPGGPILAYRQNDTVLSVRDKGPLWVVYHYDGNEDYQSEVIYSRSIWQLDRVVVLAD